MLKLHYEFVDCGICVEPYQCTKLKHRVTCKRCLKQIEKEKAWLERLNIDKVITALDKLGWEVDTNDILSRNPNCTLLKIKWKGNN